MSQVFQVFLKWSDGLKSGLLSPEDIIYLKEHPMKFNCAVLPTGFPPYTLPLALCAGLII